MLDFIKQKYKIRQCRNFKYNDRPCLNYHIKRCLAPCQGYVSREEYMEQINEIIDLLEGKTDKILKDLKNQMKIASEKQEYEKAAYIRDRMVAIDRASSMQKVSNISENNIDVIGLAKSEFQICIEVFFVRGSKMIGREHYFFTDLNDMEESEVIAGFIKQFYMDNLNIPNKIMIKEVLENEEVLEKWLSTIARHKVEIHSTKRGQKLKFVEMAENNAKVTLENKEKQKNNILLELKEVLKMDKMPRKIETYDISNISGNFMVAAMCVLKDGEIKKNLSRRFRIKTVLTQDDPRCMEEVITRRLAHSVEEPNNEQLEASTDNKVVIDDKVHKVSTKNQAFGELPDAIFADGGITQIRAIRRAIDKYNVPVKIFGMVKNDKHQTRALIDEDRNEIKISPELMLLITRFQDTVHDTAISYYRKLHEKSLSHSELDDIKGIGDAKKKALIKTFGSVEKIKQASVEELCKVKGINKELAEEIKKEL